MGRAGWGRGCASRFGLEVANGLSEMMSGGYRRLGWGAGHEFQNEGVDFAEWGNLHVW